MAALTESELPQAGRVLRWRLASDSVLARAAANGAEGAFDEIFTRYHPALVRHCRAVLLDADEAQDAAQNALTSALRALRRGTSEPISLKAWLYRIAHNEAVTLAKRRADQQARRAPGDGSEAELIPVAGPADDDTRERVTELVGDLRELPERQRGALLLRELSGLGYSEIAGVLGTSPGAARQTVFEARAALVDIGAGRDDACEDVRHLLSDGDGRVARGRRVRAHVRTCAGCAVFAAGIRGRERDLAIAFPLTGAFALMSSGGTAASLAGGAAAAGGGWSLGLGASVAVKCATVCAAAVILGAAAVEHPGSTARHHHRTQRNAATTQLAAVNPATVKRDGTAVVLAAQPVSHTQHTSRSTVAAVTRHTPAASSQTDRSAKPTTKRVVAHLPAYHPPAKSSSDSSTTSSDVPSTTTAPEVTTVASAAPSGRGNATNPLAQFVQQAVAAAQQTASSVMQQAMGAAQAQVQQGLDMARQVTQQAFGTFMHGSTRSADVPTTADSP